MRVEEDVRQAVFSRAKAVKRFFVNSIGNRVDAAVTQDIVDDGNMGATENWIFAG